MAIAASTLKVPHDFFWGAATSSHQVEGDNRFNDWWAWEQVSLVPERSGRACDHYNQYEKDLDIAQKLGHNAYRFSIEWSRVERSPGNFSEEDIVHYEKVIGACRARKLTPIVTLHHFTNPIWFVAEGGWVSPKSPELFVRYVRRVTERLHTQVSWWITINEPTVLVHEGYLAGRWPPGKRSPLLAVKAVRNLVKAHRLAYQAIRDCSKESSRLYIGLAHHVRCYDPCRRQSRADRWAAKMRHWLGNEWFLNACRGTMDFLGVNYYTRDFLRFPGKVCPPSHHRSAGPRGCMDWEIYPQGLCRALSDLKQYGLPILVAENGVCTDDDMIRWDFIRNHLSEMGKAMAGGAQVVGYLYWSLLDNFEWAHGFAPRFGLVEVDYGTMERKVRPCAEKLMNLICAREIPLDIS